MTPDFIENVSAHSAALREGLRGEDSIAELCRQEGIAQNKYYSWSKKLWKQAMPFKGGGSNPCPSFRDHETARHQYRRRVYLLVQPKFVGR